LFSEVINVELSSRSYPIVVGDGLLGSIGGDPRLPVESHCVVVSDSNVATIYLERVVAELRWRNRVDSVTLPAGETTKSIEQLSSLWEQLARFGADRGTVVVALGGGVIGDLAGFAAATYLRGLQYIQIPTSLLAQVDSSVGGKVGINLPGGKNLAGAFWQPSLVLIDTAVLQTLDAANFRSGLAEVVKYGVILDPGLFEFLEQNIAAINKRDIEVLARVIVQCCRLKAGVVSQDERETTGRRAILNYGHTFGHAIENVFGYGEYLHGEAIAIGMQAAARIAWGLGLVDEQFVCRQTGLLESFGLPLSVRPGRGTEIVSAMYRDKKICGGKLKLVLPTSIGRVQLCDAPHDRVLAQAIEYSQ
jgi:3-dehydroquinate synthase